ncbi:hypothetical protein OK349_02650 [Sphingomonas sp. BT-65]|uniref:hypothetical protein n=1 Tax=Sphingomonas sp. BT-65 TaxID=2989821 RepID=UPI0022368D76|nr:hypothetical protein [Sphingomonas sp. BT-65]MCW4460591.1 hypothetical protein [Sphingomonas sp. BT-65]
MLFAGPAPAQAQWLDSHLEAQRWNNLRKHQQRQRQRAQQKHRRGQQSSRVTLAERQSAWSRNKAEYRRRMLRNGTASADRWLDSLVLASRR